MQLETRSLREKQISRRDKATATGDWQCDYKTTTKLLENLDENINIELWNAKNDSLTEDG